MADPAGTVVPPPIGVILAGGVGRRMGGSKATVQLHGVPLINYPLAAFQTVLRDVAVIAKTDSELPGLPGVTIWIEAGPHRHPLTGITEALAMAKPRSIVVCAVDLPFVTPRLVRNLAIARAGRAPAVVVGHAGRMQPLLGRYDQRAAGPLTRALEDPEVSVQDAVAALDPRILEVDDPEILFNVNAPEDLLRAAALLDTGARAYPNVKS